ncbi:MAG: hypothetical protein WC428_02345 [Candidatus Paceibacterota bacterium]
MKTKSFLITIFISVMFFACKEIPCDVKEDIDQLKQTKSEYQNEIRDFADARAQNVHEIDSLNGILKILNIYASGKTPQYILKIHLKQSHFTLDIGKHIKDAANAIDFEIPVDKDFYNQVKVGTSIVDNFRMGSFILEGSFGNWDMTVKGKEIR